MAQAFLPRPRVLVVEDDILVRIDAVDSLEEAGYDVTDTGSADGAIIALEKNPAFFAIFTDIEMPGSMNGLRLAHAVKSRWPSVMIIATSGHLNLKAEDLPEGGQFIPKPYSSEQVTEALQRLQ